MHNDPLILPSFSVKAANKSYEFWQRDPLAIELTQKKTVMQKLQYIHDNPLAMHWQLAGEPAQYHYSSAKYYETGIDDFGFLNDITGIF